MTPLKFMKRSVITTAIVVGTLLCACGRSSAVPAEAADTTAPGWYHLPVPWNQLPLDVRARLVRSRDSLITNPPPEVRAVQGRQFLARVAKSYDLKDSAQTSIVDGRTIVWVPEDLWPRMIPINRAQLEAYASSKSPKWGIGVGPVSGGHIIEARVVVQH